MRGGQVPWRRPGALAALAGLLLACWVLGTVGVAAREVTNATAGAPELQGHHHHHHHKRRRAEPEEVTCEDVSDLDPRSDDRCAFVRTHCKSESLIDYPRLYYCHVARHKWLTYVMLLLCACLLALLFRVIARASDDYFSCILSQARAAYHMLHSTYKRNYELALGALTGAGMFVGCVVAGRIVTLSGGAKARGAQIRDVLTQFITVATVLGIVATGYFSYGSVATLLSIYAAYVVVVAVADFTHRAGVEWGELAGRVSRRWSQKWRTELVSPLLRSDYASGAAGDVAGGSPVGQPLLEWTGSAPTAQQLDRPSSGPMPTPGQPAGAPGEGWLAPAASVPHAIDGRLAGVVEAGERVPSPPAAPVRRGIIGSLPDFLGALRHEPQHLHHLQRHHPRHVPPVATFQPRMAYNDIVHMPAREYRQRALAEMAQSKSFYRPARDNELSDVDEESSSYDSGDEPAWEDAVQSPSRLPRHGEHSPPRQGRQLEPSLSPPHVHRQQQQHHHHQQPLHNQQQQQQHDEEWGHGELYEPPVASFNAAALGAAGAAQEPAAGAAVADAGISQIGAAAAGSLPTHHTHAHPAHLSHQGSGGSSSGPRFSHQGSGGGSSGPRFSHQGSGGSGGRRSALSSLSVERTSIGSAGETAAAVAAAEALAAVELERGQAQRSWLGHAIEAAQAPLMLLLQATIPLVEALLIAVGAGAALCTLGHLGTLRLGGKAPLWTLGTEYPIGAALVAVYGFGVAAMWIALFATEIVGLLQFFGMLSHLDPAILGVTVLAWGNSLMDYINNTAMAARSRGGNSMAMTACFAGPLFNMLVGLGLGFWALLSDSHMRKAAVKLDPVVLVGCIFIMLNCACVVAVALLHRQWLPAWSGWAMVGCYATYLTAVLTVLAFD
ncbi:hypothetical protein COHA_007897 [Chlorella ohadii]|uniref:Sodium/calcium exchanger membrane region domain-containing protein n=1 Tax=Chlorella ohadii TaxID=2649997 RepID=A0AAD5DL88_9CHLO|nr:hypothetical protein COHA_007897 [Chlorella ohadii]